jgi:hypothetical protein
MVSHIQGYGREGLTVREFLLCVQLFYGEIPSAAHIKEVIKNAEQQVDEAMKEMKLA